MTLDGKSAVFGIIGNPVAHSASPAMHNAMFSSLGIHAVYVPFHVPLDCLSAAILGLRALGVSGVNVTVPFKESVVPFLDELSPMANRLQAVNTIVNRDGHLVGYNTDGEGLLFSLQKELNLNLSGQNVVVLGAGGSSRSIVGTLLLAGASVTVANRSLDRLEQFRLLFGENLTLLSLTDESLISALSQANLVVQTTSVGLKDTHPLLDNFAWVYPNQCVVDIIYNPIETAFLRETRLRGAKTLNGAGMLAGQGVLGFQHFTGHLGDYELMKGQIPV